MTAEEKIPELPVRLTTADNKKVADVLIPLFNTIPEVLIWEERLFVKRGLVDTNIGRFLLYKETFAYVVPPSDLLKRRKHKYIYQKEDPANLK